eukprot:scaffold132316_cov27-Tisochrysis_lutea.AAC.11
MGIWHGEPSDAKEMKKKFEIIRSRSFARPMPYTQSRRLVADAGDAAIGTSRNKPRAVVYHAGDTVGPTERGTCGMEERRNGMGLVKPRQVAERLVAASRESPHLQVTIGRGGERGESGVVDAERADC